MFTTRKFTMVPSKVSFCGGRPEYWSPEQAMLFQKLSGANEGLKEYTHALNTMPGITTGSDVYSFGLIILEIIHQRRLWHRGDQMSTKLYMGE